MGAQRGGLRNGKRQMWLRRRRLEEGEDEGSANNNVIPVIVATENIKANVRGRKQDGGGRGDGNEIKTDSVSDGGKQEIWKLRDEIKMCAWCRKTKSVVSDGGSFPPRRGQAAALATRALAAMTHAQWR